MSDKENLPKEEIIEKTEKSLKTTVEEATTTNTEKVIEIESEAKEVEIINAEISNSEEIDDTTEEASEEKDSTSENTANLPEKPKETETPSEEKKEYNLLTKEQLTDELRLLIKNGSIQNIKNEVEEVKNEFNTKFQLEIAEKKEEFLQEGGNIIDFHYSTPQKKEFNSLYFDYKEKRSIYYKTLKKDLTANLSKRLEIIEELKGLLSVEESINSTYKHFKDIQNRWREAGNIPRDKYNTVWNTYHHHVENFYDFLHLNRDFRDMDFKHNLDQKLKLIGRAEELNQEQDIHKAFRELQMLHKMWKEEVGPVAKEFREDVWGKFSTATKLIHDKRHLAQKDIEKSYELNLGLKKEIIENIKAISNQEKPTHKNWQKGIKKVQELRDKFFAIGKVPKKNNSEIWDLFKNTTKDFNQQKNAFYKSQKLEQYTNLEKKQELIKIAEENKDGDDFNIITPLMKNIQNQWKEIGHVPRKDSDKIWKQFKNACNFYFDRIHSERNEANKEEIVSFEAKKELLDSLKTLEFSGKKKDDLSNVMGKIKQWKDLGKVPYNKRHIEGKFNKKLDSLFAKIDLDKKEVELIKFENKISSILSQDDERKLRNEQIFISKKISDVKQEINQLENNLGFFQYADQENPLVKEVHNNIANHKESLEVWKAKLNTLKSMC